MKIELSNTKDNKILLTFWHWELCGIIPFPTEVERTCGIYDKETNTLAIPNARLKTLTPMIKALAKWNDKQKGGYIEVKITIIL